MDRTDWNDQQGAIIISWEGVARGRESKAFEVFGKAVGYYADLEKAGTLTGTQVYFNTTGSARGFILLSGRLDTLNKLTLNAEFSKLQQEGALVADDFQVNLAMGGGFDSVAEGMAANYTTLQEHGLA
jgi:hypothetical protein